MRAVLDLSGARAKLVVFSGRRPVYWAMGESAAPPALPGGAGRRLRTVSLLLPGTAVLERVLTLPPVPRRHLPDLLRHEVRRLWHLDPEDLHLAWHVLGRKPRLTVLAALIQKDVLNRHLEWLAELGLRCRAIHLPCACLHAALPAGTGTVVHLGDDGVVTLVGYAGGRPLGVNRGFVRGGEEAAPVVAQLLRAMGNAAGGALAEAPAVITGPLAADRVVADLAQLGVAAVRASWQAGGPDVPADALALGLGAAGRLAARLQVPVPRQPRAPVAARRALAAAVACVLAAGASLGARGLVARLQAGARERQAAARVHLGPLQGSEPALAELQAARARLAELARDLAEVRREPDLGALLLALNERARRIGVSLFSAGPLPGAPGLLIQGTAPALPDLDRLVDALGQPPFAGAHVVRFEGGQGVRFTLQARFEGGQADR